MDDGDLVQHEAMPTVGERLRAAREAAGMTLEDVATNTRIPTRHLEALENSDFDRLPAPTYTIGFAKNYAAAVGLDRREVADQLRGEIGGLRPASHHVDSFEPADPARSFPKWLLLAVLAGIVIVIAGFSWLRSREYAEDPPLAAEATTVNQAPPAQAATAAPAPAATPAQGPVVITATEEVWLQVKDGGATLKEGILQAGETFEIPTTASAPVLTTGKPQALRISVGNATAPPVGPAATTVSNVSLLPADLLRQRPAPGAAPANGAATAN